MATKGDKNSPKDKDVRKNLHDLASIVTETKNLAKLVIQDDVYKQGTKDHEQVCQLLMEKLYVLDKGMKTILSDCAMPRSRSKRSLFQDKDKNADRSMAQQLSGGQHQVLAQQLSGGQHQVLQAACYTLDNYFADSIGEAA